MPSRTNLLVIATLTGIGIFLVTGCNSNPPSEVKPTIPGVAKTTTPKADGTAKPEGRAQVQHGLDADVAKVNTTPVSISVEDLLAFRDKGTSKVDLGAYHQNRVAPFETTSFEVKSKIKSIVHEKDGDFYMVVQGKTGKEAIVEVPDPKLCQGSPLLPQISEARKKLEARYHPTSALKDLNEEITVDGVGFLGSRRKRGSGTFGSSVRLMPGLGVKFP